MDVCFLGYQNLNFDSNDGNHIEGIKFYFYFPSKKNNYVGFECGGIFVSKMQQILVDIVKKCVPGNYYHLDMEFDGKKAVFAGISEVKKS